MRSPEKWSLPLLTPDVFQDEPAHGLLLRLSDRNGIPRMSVMRAMTGIDLRRVRTGHQLQVVADLAGCCTPELGALHYKKLPARSVEIRGELLRFPSDVLVHGRRLCVKCLDEEYYHRFWWDLSMVATCPKHSLVLTGACSCGTRLSWGDGAIAKCADCADGDARGAQPQPAQDEDVALDRWILSRFGVTQISEPELLSRLPITGALEIIERVAALGLAQHPSKFQFLQRSRRSIWVRGYKCIAEGRVQDALDQAYRLSRAGNDRHVDITTAYGPFWDWLVSRGGENFCSPLSRIVQTHSSAIFSLSNGMSASASRRIQTPSERDCPHEATPANSREFGTRAAHTSWTVGLDVDAIRTIDRRRPYIDDRELQGLLHVSAGQIGDLIEFELLTRRDGGYHAQRRPYLRAEVEKLLDELKAEARMSSKEQSDLDSIVTLCERHAVSLGGILAAMRRGELSVAALRRGSTGLRALLVRVPKFLNIVEQLQVAV